MTDEKVLRRSSYTLLYQSEDGQTLIAGNYHAYRNEEDDGLHRQTGGAICQGQGTGDANPREFKGDRL